MYHINLHTTLRTIAASTLLGLTLASTAQAATEYVAIGPNGENLTVQSLGSDSVAISANGSKVFFYGATSVQSGSGQTQSYMLIGRNRQTQTSTRLDTTIDASNIGFDSSMLIGGVSGDGRSLLFRSSNPKLVPNDTNNSTDLFVSDLQSGTIRRVNLTDSGAQSDSSAIISSHISADARYVAFVSSAKNLLQGASSTGSEPYFTFVRDLQSGTIKVLNPFSTGAYQPKQFVFGLPNVQLSGDGRFVAFQAFATQNTGGFFVADQLAGTYSAIPEAAWPLGTWSLAANGRYLALKAALNETTPAIKIFDRQSQAIETITDATNAPAQTTPLSISANGRYLTYVDQKNNAIVYDRQTKERTNLRGLGAPEATGFGNVAISGDGRHIMVKEVALANPLFQEDGFCSIYNPYVSQ